MQRYFLRLSYNGAHFRGSQKQQSRMPPHLWTPEWLREERKTVQGALETFLVRLKPLNEPIVQLSSRTDGGVHASDTSASVDLLKSERFYDPRDITSLLNHCFLTSRIPIRIHRTLAIPGDFCVRKKPISRCYVYKLAVPKYRPSQPTADQYRNKRTRHLHLPCCHADFWFQARQPLDMIKLAQVLHLFQGTHNFSGFASPKTRKARLRVEGEEKWIELPDSYFARNIDQCRMLEWSMPVVPEFAADYLQDYDFYHIYIKSKSFFRHQVRRMVWLAMSVAEGRTKYEQVCQILSGHDWANVHMAPAHGLHLIQVQYAQEDLNEAAVCLSQLPVGPEPDFEPQLIQWNRLDEQSCALTDIY